MPEDLSRWVVPLEEATDPAEFGGKAAQLAVALAHGLPVPPGVGLAWPLVEAVGAGDDAALRAVADGCAALDGPLVVRSSAVGEDSADASFAGQHLSLLGVPGPGAVAEAVVTVGRSAGSEPALAYRDRLGLPPDPRVGVVVQRLVDPDVAGVLFDVNPLTGADEVVIEASWGLGETVVSGTVTPDLFRLGPAGQLLEYRRGTKDVEVRPSAAGGTVRLEVDEERSRARSLTGGQLVELHALALRCRAVFGGTQDLEWAFAGESLWLLQRRPLTR